jgi:hypothetical protein
MKLQNNRPETPIDYLSYLVFEDEKDWEENPIDLQERPITITFSSFATYDDEIVFVSLKPRVLCGEIVKFDNKYPSLDIYVPKEQTGLLEKVTPKQDCHLLRRLLQG